MHKKIFQYGTIHNFILVIYDVGFGVICNTVKCRFKKCKELLMLLKTPINLDKNSRKSIGVSTTNGLY